MMVAILIAEAAVVTLLLKKTTAAKHNLKEHSLPESAGVFAILKGLDCTSKSNWEIFDKA